MNARCFGTQVVICFLMGLLFVTSLGAQNVAAGRRNPLQIALLEWYEINQTASFYAGHCNENRVWGGAIAGLAFDGTNVWMSTGNDPCGGPSGTYKVRVSDGFIVRCGPSSNSTQGRLAYDGINMWVTDGGLGITKVRSSDCTSLGTFIVGYDTGAVAFDGTAIWVVATGSNTLTKLKVTDGSVLLGPLEGLGGYGLAFDGSNVWVVTANQTFKVRSSDGGVVGTFPVGGNAIAFDGTNMWVTGSQTLKLRVTDGAVLGTFPVAGNGIAFDGVNIWVTGGQTFKLRASDGLVMGKFAGTSGPAIAFDGADIWVVNSIGEILFKL